MVESTRESGEKTEFETRFYITSLLLLAPAAPGPCCSWRHNWDRSSAAIGRWRRSKHADSQDHRGRDFGGWSATGIMAVVHGWLRARQWSRRRHAPAFGGGRPLQSNGYAGAPCAPNRRGSPQGLRALWTVRGSSIRPAPVLF